MDRAGNGAMARFGRKVALAMMAAVVAAGMVAVPFFAPQKAVASELSPANALAVQAKSTAQAKKAVKYAKAVIKKAKATKGNDAAKLKKVYAYLAKDKQFGGVYQFGDVLSFYMKYGKQYYDPNLNNMKNSLVKKNYLKYAIDLYKEKKGTCYNYAALMAVTAKQLLGNDAVVKIAVGPSKHTGVLNKYHSWVEVTMDGQTLVYDTQAGNNASKKAGKATAFGKFCGTPKAKLKANYKNFKGVTYCTVKL